MNHFTLSAFGDEIDAMLQKQMEELEKNDIKFIELRNINGKNVSDHSPAELSEIKKQMQAKGFGVSAIGSPIGKVQIDSDLDKHVDYFKNTLEGAKAVGAERIRMFSFYNANKIPHEQYRDLTLKYWVKFSEAAKGYDIMLVHENEHAIYGESPEACLEIINAANCSYVSAVFDPANFVLDGYDTLKAFDILKDHVTYVHIKDAIYSSHKIVPAGKGEGNIENILNQLKNRNYKGFLSIEPHLASGDIAVGGVELFKIAADAIKDIIARVI